MNLRDIKETVNDAAEKLASTAADTKTAMVALACSAWRLLLSPS